MLPGVQTDMEGCPTFDENLNLLYMMLTSLLWLGLLFTCKRIKAMRRSSRQKQSALQQAALRDDEFEGLQMILYGGTSSSNAANNDQMRRRYKTWKSGASTVYC
jgi:hypothetical protein